jgi:hypothetical protein
MSMQQLRCIAKAGPQIIEDLPPGSETENIVDTVFANAHRDHAGQGTILSQAKRALCFVPDQGITIQNQKLYMSPGKTWKKVLKNVS